MKKNPQENSPATRRRGRPIATNPKVARIQICLTLDELATITAAAGNVRVSEWARDALAKAAKRSTNMTLTTRQK
jgi:hypothetical protein